MGGSALAVQRMSLLRGSSLSPPAAASVVMCKEFSLLLRRYSTQLRPRCDM